GANGSPLFIDGLWARPLRRDLCGCEKLRGPLTLEVSGPLTSTSSIPSRCRGRVTAIIGRRVAEEVDGLLAGDGIARDHPRPPARAARDLAGGLRIHHVGGPAPDRAEDADARLHRRVHERAEGAASPTPTPPP